MHNLFLKEGTDGWSRTREGSGRSQVRAAAQDLPAAKLRHSDSTRQHQEVWKLSVVAKERDFGYKRGHFYSEHCELT